MELADKIARNLMWLTLPVLPADPRKAVCTSYYGRGFSDSPGAVASELLSRGWKVFWEVDGPEAEAGLPEGIIPVRRNSPAAVWHQCTAGAWVDNCRKWGRIRKGRGRFYVQTWHGFPLKRIEGDASDALPEDYLRAARGDSAMCDLFLSDSSFLTEIYRRAFWYGGEVLECGFPRNDILLAPEAQRERAAEAARRALGLPEGRKLLLYAPTFRKDKGLGAYDLDYARCAAALGRRFGGEWLILARLHPNVARLAGELGLDPALVVNASDYPDIQALYLLSDALVTDYSSVMFDYLYTGKPCFLYVNDLEAYRNDRNFYFDLDRLPFVRAETNDGLEAAVSAFDAEAQRARAEAFCREFGLVESGEAARRTADWLEEHLPPQK